MACACSSTFDGSTGVSLKAIYIYMLLLLTYPSNFATRPCQGIVSLTVRAASPFAHPNL